MQIKSESLSDSKRCRPTYNINNNIGNIYFVQCQVIIMINKLLMTRIIYRVHAANVIENMEKVLYSHAAHGACALQSSS